MNVTEIEERLNTFRTQLAVVGSIPGGSRIALQAAGLVLDMAQEQLRRWKKQDVTDAVIAEVRALLHKYADQGESVSPDALLQFVERRLVEEGIWPR